MRVREIMTEPVVVVREDATLQEVARLMLEREIGSAPVVDSSGKLVGLVTEADFVGRERVVPSMFPTKRLPQVFERWIDGGDPQKLLEEIQALRVGDVLTRNAATATEDEPVVEVLARMAELGVSRIPVVRNGKPVGIVTHHDILRMIAAEVPARAAEPREPA